MSQTADRGYFLQLQFRGWGHRVTRGHADPVAGRFRFVREQITLRPMFLVGKIERAKLEAHQAYAATLLRRQRLDAAREKLRERFADVVTVNADRSSAALGDALVGAAG